MSGQAASYHNPSQAFGEAPQSGQQQQQPVYNNAQQYAPYPNQSAPEAKPPQNPPTYNQAVYGFDEAFMIEKPKFNDLWAGLLVRPRPLPSSSLELKSLTDTIIAHSSFPRLRRRIRPDNPSLRQVQRFQRRGYLRCRERSLAQHEHPGPFHIRPLRRDRVFLGLLYGCAVFP